MRYQGKITKWNDGKGFGFITRNDGNQQVFVHISAFDKSKQGIRPLLGDEVSFEIADDVKKGLQAYNVIYLNKRPSSATRKSSAKRTSAPASGIRLGALVKIFAVILLGLVLYKNADILNSGVTHTASDRVAGEMAAIVEVDESKAQRASNQAFTCSGKTHCSQMISCDEAKYYLKNCPGTITDGDHDGVPCEDQWCGH